MSQTLLLLVRHAATPANLCRPYKIQGLLPDPDLAEVGVVQAQVMAQTLRTYPIAKVYSSPLCRAWQTAQAIPGMVVVEPRLAEADTGLWTGLTWQEVEQRWPAEHRAFREDAERHGYLGGENLAQVRDRVLPAVEELVARHPGQTFVVVSHGVVNRVLLAHWLGIPPRFARRLPQDNAGFNVVTFAGGVATVRTLNQAGHLAGLLAEAA